MHSLNGEKQTHTLSFTTCDDIKTLYFYNVFSLPCFRFINLLQRKRWGASNHHFLKGKITIFFCKNYYCTKIAKYIIILFFCYILLISLCVSAGPSLFVGHVVFFSPPFLRINETKILSNEKWEKIKTKG